jgi:UDP-N-acetylmuramate: L-alanyl-gamma-D-glutamyl-meso-diaminopimelate ligase
MAAMAGKSVHVIGVAGIGMSAVALLLKAQGWRVTGSDEAFYPPASDILRAAQIDIRSPHAAANIPAETQRFVIGKHAKLTMDNPEVAAAYRHGAPVMSYPDVLHELLEGRTPWVVAGSYGKSTTAAILSWTLRHACVDAGYFVGAVPKGMSAPAHLGTHPVFVLEGDEYPSSNADPRSKFLLYRAHDVLLTSAAHDHVNIFPTQDDYLKPFRTLIDGLPREGLLVACKDEPFAMQIAKGAKARVVTYALDDTEADYRAANIRYGLATRFDLIVRGRSAGSFETQMLGAHNVQNLVGAAALMLEREVLSADAIAAAFREFAGVKRRMDRVTARSAVPLYEGFGSSLDKARSAIEAMRLHFPDRKLAVVFEPHTFSWRSEASIDWYDTVFRGVNLVAILPPPDHGHSQAGQLTQADIAKRVAKVYGRSLQIQTPRMGEWGASLLPEVDRSWVVLALSSGAMGGGLPRFAEALDRRFLA